MLDADPVKLVQTGTVTVEGDKVFVEGFRSDNGTCREVAALAVLWAIGRLQQELQATMGKPGGGNVVLD